MKNNNKILVNVTTKYEPSQSDVDNQKFVWSYNITIENNSNEVVQLLKRFWRITEMNGKVEEISGVGVVGLQPIIKPQRPFVYSSYCQLTTPQGTMEGHYEMQTLEESHFKIIIPKFILSAPTNITFSFRAKLH